MLTDHLGSTVAVTNASGTLTSQQRYLPFGGVRSIPKSPILATDFGYTGQRLLDAGMGGIMDYKARFYSPALGRFVQPDSIIPDQSNPQSWNRFSYVGNNPIRFNDPTGHVPNSVGPSDDLPFFGFIVVILAVAIVGQYDRSRRHGSTEDTDCLDTLADCFKQRALVNFAPNQTIDQQEFHDMLNEINDDLHKKWRTSYDPARADYDTPFFNGDDGSGNVDDDVVCINDKCSPQSAVNYAAQGMYSAYTGQSLEDAEGLADSWNFWMHSGGAATEDELYWLKYGYDYYNSINSDTRVNGASKKRNGKLMEIE
ncbi:MAG: RHS repeat-associated core domain-containing protein [Anaerolineales bacterium]|nr:RHS repeat-associated core domain-containing protein [Anaerolineales bacterium]